jgi:hypothetical protein
MSTENQEVSVEPAAEEKTEKEVKGTKRAAEVSILGDARMIIARKSKKLIKTRIEKRKNY